MSGVVLNADQSASEPTHRAQPPPRRRYDVFMCHNRLEKPVVKDISDSLQIDAGLLFFLDEYSIPASVEFLAFIETELRASATCAVFLGAEGWGPTHLTEARLALAIKQERPDFRIIPVKLPGAREEDWIELFGGLPQYNWVDFNDPTSDEARRRLIEAVQGDFRPNAAGPEVVTPYYVRRQAALWEKSAQKDSSLLLRGNLLRQAQARAAENPDFVSVNSVPAFLARCVEAERDRLRIGVGLAVGVALFASALGLVALEQRNRARDEAEIALSRSLAANAVRTIGESRNDERAALLARQAFLLDEKHGGRSSSLVEASLREVLQTPHFGSEYRLAKGAEAALVSPNAGFILVKQPRWSLIGPIVAKGGARVQEQVIDLGSAIAAASFVPGGDDRFVVLTEGGHLELREVRAPEQAVWRSPHFRVTEGKLAISPDGKYAVVAHERSRLTIFELGREGPPRDDWRLPMDIGSLAASRSADLVAVSAADDQRLLVFAAGTQKPRAAYPSATRPQAFAFLPTRDQLVVGEQMGGVWLWTPTARSHQRALLGRAPGGSVDNLALSADGGVVATASGSVTPGIRFWRVDSPGDAALPEIPGVRGVADLRMSADGRYLVSVTYSGEVRYWRIAGVGAERAVSANDHQRTTYPPLLFGLARAPDSDALVVVGGHGTLQFWPSADLRAPPKVLATARDEAARMFPALTGRLMPSSHIMAVSFASSGNLFATADVYGIALVWNARAPGAAPRVLPPPPNPRPAFALAFSPSGRRLVVAATSGNIRVHSLRDDGESNGVVDLPSEGSETVRAALFLNESTLLVGDDAGRLTRWSLEGEPSRTEIINGGGLIVGLTRLADGRIAVARSQRIELGRPWDASWNGEVLSAGLGTIYSLTAADDGSSLAAGFEDGAVRIWRLGDTRSEPTLIAGAHRGPVRGVAFDRSGEALGSVGDDSMIRNWVIGRTRLAGIVCDVVWRDLTDDERREFFPPSGVNTRTCP